MSEDEIKASLLAFIRDYFQASGDPEIDEETPLVDSGILDSLKTAMLHNYIRDGLHTPIPIPCIDAKNFKDVSSIISMIRELATPSGQ